MTISGRFRIGEWSVDPALDEISRGAEVVKLEPRMTRLLCRLAESRSQVVSYRDLLDSVWAGVVVGPASVYQGVSALRRILGDTGDTPTYIATVSRKGYRLVAPVEMPAGSPVAQDDPGTPSATPVPSRRMTRRGAAALALAIVTIAATLYWVLTPRKNAESVAPVTQASPVAWPPPDLPSLSILPLEASTPGAPNELFAATVTDLLQGSLMKQKGLLLVSLLSAGKLGEPGADVRELGRRLHVKYVLRGDAARDENRLRIDLTLVDTVTAAPLWSQSYTRAAHDIDTLREEIISHLGTRLGVRMTSAGRSPVNLEAHEEYVRGMREYQKFTTESFRASRDIFQRATELYPDYAHNYFGLAVAVKMFQWFPDPRDSGIAGRWADLQRTALDRALVLDPESGETVIERATITPDPREAEQLFIRGMDLAPSYGFGPYHYTPFLLANGRDGEAISVIDRGLRIDPLNAALMGFKATFLRDYRGDIAGHEALLREVLANSPNDAPAAIALGWSRYALSGETADGIDILEREAQRDPAGYLVRQAAAMAYLDVDDPAAAESVGKGIPLAALMISQYHRAAHPLASFPADAFSSWHGFSQASFNPVVNALRDDALATGQYATALDVFEKVRSANPTGGLNMASMNLVYAHTLILSGDTERGHALAKSLLQLFEVEQVGRPPDCFARLRAMAYALLGDDERAIAELTASVQHHDLTHWWYTAELDPLFAHLRKDPRFQALAQTARQHRANQRALLDEMRRKGKVPQRP